MKIKIILLVVDWGVGAQTINFVTARNRVGPTGIGVAIFIDRLVAAGLTTLNQVQIVGHSLG